MNIEMSLASIGGQKSLANGRAELEPEMHRGSIVVASDLHDEDWVASQIWGGNSLAVNQCQRWLEMFAVFGRDAVQAPGRGESGED